MEWVYGHIIIAIGLILGIVFITHLSMQRRTTSNVFAWLLLIVFVPYIGVPLYLIFGGSKINDLVNTKRKIYEEHRSTFHPYATETEKILSFSSIPSAVQHNAITILSSGEEAYQTIMFLIDQAQETIEVETFILGKGAVGVAILEKLTEKAAQGVQVRFLLDGLVAFMYPKKHLRLFRKAGGKLVYFLPLRFRIFRSHVNLRNHRKLFIADGKYAVMGGMNLAEEYMGPTPSKTRWCDIAIRVEGEIVQQLRHLFYADWHFASSETVSLPTIPADTLLPIAPMQIVPSGPDVFGESFYNALLINIFKAKERIILVTPYFVPDFGLAKALALACLRGVKVTLVIPHASNHRMADFARSVHVRNLLFAGGEVLFFEPTMLHAKVVVFDDMAIVGSANLDMRSLFLNFEACLFFYGKNEIDDIVKWVQALKMYCSDKHSVLNPTGLRLFMENVALLMAPLL